MDVTNIVAFNVKNIREKKKLTLDAAAKLTGVSRSMLAQIEKGDVNPTVTVLWKIANGYKVSFSTLVERQEEGVRVVRQADIEPLQENDGGCLNYPIFTFDEKTLFELYRIVIGPAQLLATQPHLKGTEEYITVFAGEVEITVKDERFLLGKGDSIRFLADVPHTYRNTGEDSVELSMLIYYHKE